MDIHEWIKFGIEHKYCSEVHCSIHAGPPMSESEMHEFDDGFDPCIFAVRIFESPDEFIETEKESCDDHTIEK